MQRLFAAAGARCRQLSVMSFAVFATDPRPSFEFQLRSFSFELRTRFDNAAVAAPSESNADFLVRIVMPRMEGLVEAFIRDNIEACSDIRYNADLAKSLIAEEDYTDLLQGNFDEMAIRMHLRSLMRMYLGEVNRARPIHITDQRMFSIHMESLGLSVTHNNTPWTAASQSLLPDGNVVVMSVLTLGLGLGLLLLSLRRDK